MAASANSLQSAVYRIDVRNGGAMDSDVVVTAYWSTNTSAVLGERGGERGGGMPSQTPDLEPNPGVRLLLLRTGVLGV